MSQKNYCEYIKHSIPYSEEFNPVKFIEDNFLEDGKAFVYNKSDNFLSFSKSEQYEVVISSIAEISYNYYITMISGLKSEVVELASFNFEVIL